MLKIKLEDAHIEYEAWLRARMLARASIINDTYAPRLLMQTVGNIWVSNITHQHIDKVFTSHPDWSAATRNMRLGSFKRFFSWAQSRNYMDPRTDLMHGWRNIKEPKRRMVRVPQSKFAAMLDTQPWPVRRMYLALGLYTMMRTSEITALRVADVHLDEYSLSIYRGKTKQADTLPISLELADELRPYLTWYADRLMRQGEALQPHHVLLPARTRATDADRDPRTGRIAFNPESRELVPTQCPAANLQKDVVQGALAQLGYSPEDYHMQQSHVLRRSGARALFDHLVEDGYDGALRIVQAFLGHASSTQTERYIGIELDLERRNKMFQGKRMYGERAGNVVNLFRERESTGEEDESDAM